MNFYNANTAFIELYRHISRYGEETQDTFRVRNLLFKIERPLDNAIIEPARKWSHTYAEREWQWYLSRNPNATEIAKYAPTWYRHIDTNGFVHSNYGYQWGRNGQLDYVIKKLSINNKTRQAGITIYDGKEHDQYEFDTPCTLNVFFQRIDNVLDMTVTMRSNDLWFGFCNDQYCFSNLQRHIADILGLTVGSYTHFAIDMHIYKPQLNKF